MGILSLGADLLSGPPMCQYGHRVVRSTLGRLSAQEVDGAPAEPLEEGAPRDAAGVVHHAEHGPSRVPIRGQPKKSNRKIRRRTRVPERALPRSRRRALTGPGTTG